MTRFIHNSEQHKDIKSLSSELSPSPFLTYHDYVKAYEEGKVTPAEVRLNAPYVMLNRQ
jgi:hypothetical protein